MASFLVNSEETLNEVLRREIENNSYRQYADASEKNETRGIKILNQDALIAEKCRLYREGTRLWVFKLIWNWTKNDNSKIFALIGQGGTGKSVISAVLTKLEKHFDGFQVIAHHFCRHDNPEGSSPMNILSSLLGMLCVNVKDFEKFLVEKFSSPSRIKAILNSGIMEDICDELIIAPLKKCQPSSGGGVHIIVIDALDELPKDVIKQVMQLITKCFIKLPSWIKIFLTSREDPQIIRKLEPFNPVSLKCDEARNREDLRIYLKGIIKKFVKDDISVEAIEAALSENYGVSFQGALASVVPFIEKQRSAFADAIKVSMKTDQKQSLLRLKAISEQRPQELRQKSENYEQLRIEAEACQNMLKEKAESKEWKKWCGRPTFPPGIKTSERCLQKAQNDYDGDVMKLLDISRCSFVFKTCKEIVEAFQALEKIPEFRILRVKNKFQNPTSSGYSDLNMNLEWKGNNGITHIFEIQLHLEAILYTKHHICTEYYNGIRTQIPKLCGDRGLNKKARDEVERYILDQLNKSAIDPLIQILDRKADGLFIWARMLEEHFENSKGEKIDFENLSSLPAGMSHMYYENFNRVFPNEASYKVVQDFISILVAAQEPLSSDFVQHALDIDTTTLEHTKESTALLFPLRQDGKFHVMHKSVIDWLAGVDADRFRIGIPRIEMAHGRIATYCLSCNEGNLDSYKYALKHVITHLCQCRRVKDAQDLILNWDWLLDKIRITTPTALTKDAKLVVDVTHEINGDSESLRFDAIRNIERALQLCLPSIIIRSEFLAPQLLGHLLTQSRKNDYLYKLLERILQIGVKNGKKIWFPSQQTMEQAGGPCQMTLSLKRAITSVAAIENGKYFAAGSYDKTVTLFDSITGETEKIFAEHTAFVKSLAWRNDGKLLASGGDDRTIKIWNVATGDCEKTLSHGHNVVSVSWESNLLVSASGFTGTDIGGLIKVWDPSTGVCIKEIVGHKKYIKAIALSKDETCVASGSGDKTVKIWDLASGKCKFTLEGHNGTIVSVAWSNSGKVLATGGNDALVKIWNPLTADCLHTLSDHSKTVYSLSWSYDDQNLASSSGDRSVKIWNSSSTFENTATLQGHSSNVYAVAWMSNTKLISSGEDTSVKLWDTSVDADDDEIEGHKGAVSSVSWSPKGEKLASGSWDNTVIIWNANTGEIEKKLKGHTSDVLTVSWSIRGPLASAGADRAIRLWQVSTSECIEVSDAHGDEVNAVAWNLDGDILASCSGDSTVKLWNDSGELLKTLEGHALVYCVAWTSGNRLASGGLTIKVWNTVTGECTNTLMGHESIVFGLSWSVQGILASGSGDMTVKIWNLDNNECETTLEGHSSFLKAVTWSKDGLLLSRTADTSYIWDTETKKCEIIENEWKFPNNNFLLPLSSKCNEWRNTCFPFTAATFYIPHPENPTHSFFQRRKDFSGMHPCECK
eukprot:g2318.t1